MGSQNLLRWPYTFGPSWAYIWASETSPARTGGYRGTWIRHWGPYFVDHRWLCLHVHATRDEALDCARRQWEWGDAGETGRDDVGPT